MTHPTTVPLTTDASQHPAVFAAAFNSGDPLAVARVYAPGAVFVPTPGHPVTGPELTHANTDFLALGLPITVHPRHTYVADDIALLIVDWTIDGPGPDGTPVHLEGTATDVARRDPDGRWRYIIDNPFGTATG
ncbi:YybH family protein [Kitasatospora sp. NPDC091207]|uniref:YybH family protein n=1 Tax=Kitasatospora sp. NPDC091207 TaxID=3364083 RepID=UPI003809E87B